MSKDGVTDLRQATVLRTPACWPGDLHAARNPGCSLMTLPPRRGCANQFPSPSPTARLDRTRTLDGFAASEVEREEQLERSGLHPQFGTISDHGHCQTAGTDSSSNAITWQVKRSHAVRHGEGARALDHCHFCAGMRVPKLSRRECRRSAGVPGSARQPP
jgi:hypothetical protein